METHLEPLWRELMGAELRAERHRQRRTLAEVAGAAGVSMQHLSDVERGRKDPSSELLAAILGALGVDLPLLLLRAADGVLVRTRPARAAAPVLELHSSPAGAGSPVGPGVQPSSVGPRTGVTLLAVA